MTTYEKHGDTKDDSTVNGTGQAVGKTDTLTLEKGVVVLPTPPTPMSAEDIAHDHHMMIVEAEYYIKMIGSVIIFIGFIVFIIKVVIPKLRRGGAYHVYDGIKSPHESYIVNRGSNIF